MLCAQTISIVMKPKSQDLIDCRLLNHEQHMELYVKLKPNQDHTLSLFLQKSDMKQVAMNYK